MRNGPLKRFLCQQPIRTRLTVIIFAASSLIVAIMAVVTLLWELNNIRTETLRETETAVNVLSQDFAKIILLDEPDIAADAVSKLRAFDQIENAILYNRKGDSVFSFHRNPAQHITQKQGRPGVLHEHNDYMHLTLPLQYSDSELGSVYFRLSRQTLLERKQEFIQNTMIMVPALLMVSFLVALYFQKMFSGPIKRLADTVNRITEHNDYSLNIEHNERYEIGSLFDGFNHMLTRINEAQINLHTQKERLQITLESIADGVITTDQSGKIRYMNPVAIKLTGWQLTEARQHDLSEVFPVVDETSQQSVLGEIEHTVLAGDTLCLTDQVELIDRQGQHIAVQVSIAPIRDREQAIIGTVVIFHNVTESRRLTRQLHHQATHDSLTNMVNRHTFEKLIDSALQQNEEEHSLMYLDLDQFKIVNDTCGHIAGDELLKQVSHSIKKSLRDEDIVARLGGDEFGILLLHCHINDAVRIADNVRKNISDMSFHWDGKTFRIGVSIGLIRLDTSYQDPVKALSHADVACYAAKDLGRDRVHVYQNDDIDLARRQGEMQWVSRINQAFTDERFVLYAQRIQDISTDRPSHFYEVLVRMTDEEGLLIPPGAFIPAAERYNLMPRIDRWVIETLCRQPVLRNSLEHKPHCRFTINLSGTSLTKEDMADFVESVFARYAVNPECVCFEITETAAIANLSEAHGFIQRARRLGCKFALDDFGSGVSSFSYLKNLPVDYLKIDGTFVRDMAEDPIDEAMVRAIHEIGQVMKIKTIAEFVENEESLDKLRVIGLNYAQGYHIHRPCALSEINLPETNLSIAQIIAGGVN